MAYVNRPYGSGYCETDQAMCQDGAYGSAYSSEYRIDEYGNRVPLHHRHHHNGMGEVVGEVVSDVIPGGHSHYQHGRPAEVIERREERIVAEDGYNTCNRPRNFF